VIYAPIIVTVYDRLRHLQQSVDALQRNAPAAESELYLVSDGPAKAEHEPRIARVRDYARSITGFKRIRLVFREKNFGAHASFMAITRQVLDDHGRFIFLEDDVVAAPNFLNYMNDGLDFYALHPRVFSIAGYTYSLRWPNSFAKDVFFLPSNCPWGFASWKDRWDTIDFSDKDRYSMVKRDKALRKRAVATGRYMLGMFESDSRPGEPPAPDIRIAFHQFFHDVFTVYPRLSKTMNIGLDGSGMNSHTDRKNKYLVQLDPSGARMVFDADVRLDPEIVRRVRNFQNGNWVSQVLNRLRMVKFRYLQKRHARRPAADEHAVRS
jgi:hypothetical protein